MSPLVPITGVAALLGIIFWPKKKASAATKPAIKPGPPKAANPAKAGPKPAGASGGGATPIKATPGTAGGVVKPESGIDPKTAGDLSKTPSSGSEEDARTRLISEYVTRNAIKGAKDGAADAVTAFRNKQKPDIRQWEMEQIGWCSTRIVSFAGYPTDRDAAYKVDGGTIWDQFCNAYRGGYDNPFIQTWINVFNAKAPVVAKKKSLPSPPNLQQQVKAGPWFASSVGEDGEVLSCPPWPTSLDAYLGEPDDISSDGTETVALTCDLPGQMLNDDGTACVADPTWCPTGFHMVDGTCVLDGSDTSSSDTSSSDSTTSADEAAPHRFFSGAMQIGHGVSGVGASAQQLASAVGDGTLGFVAGVGETIIGAYDAVKNGKLFATRNRVPVRRVLRESEKTGRRVVSGVGCNCGGPAKRKTKLDY